MISRTLLLFCLLGFLAISANSWPTERLYDRKHLHLVKGVYTTGTKPVDQLTCIGDSNLCTRYGPNVVDCYNEGYWRGSIKWRCEAVLQKGVYFDRLDVGCEKDPDDWVGDRIITGSCGLTYSLRKPSAGSVIAGWIFGVIFVILFFSCIVFMCMKCCQGEVGGTVYTTHSPTVVTRPAIYTTPTVVAPAVVAPTYYPPPYTTTNIGYTGTSYRNDAYENTHVSTGYAGTSFRNDDNYSSGYTGGGGDTDTGYAGTSFR